MARNFNGTSDHIRIDDVARTIVWYNDPFGRTFCGWIKAPAGQSNAFMYSEGNAGSNSPFWGLSIVQASPPTNFLRFSGANAPAMTSSVVVADSTWHHVALVLYPNPTGTNNWAGLYVDGVLDQTQPNLTSIQSGATTNEATLGALRRLSGTPGNFFKGLLAHWAIWNRALSAEEIRMLARGMRMPSDFAPTHYWPLTDGQVGFIEDRGHSRVHGLRIGSTVSADAPPIRERVTPATWPHRYGAIASSSVTITLTDSAVIRLGSDGASQALVVSDGGKTQLRGDSAVSWPLYAGQGAFTLQADDPLMSGPWQPLSGVMTLKGDAPAVAGPAKPANSGVMRLEAGQPTLWTSTRPFSGVIRLTGTGPTIIPYQSPAGKITLKADKATLLSPVKTASGRIRLAGDPPTVYPLTAGRAKIAFAAGNDLLAERGIVVHSSGIIRLLADVPIVTPLTEPPPPPPPPLAGEGIALRAVV